MKSYTRAWQKPRIYDVGGQPIVELPAEDVANEATFGNHHTVPISPADGLPGNESLVSPVSPTPRRAQTLPWGECERRPGWDEWRRINDALK